jgi:hypothetical protein
VKQHQRSSLSQKVLSVTREPKEKHQVTSDRMQKNMTVGAIRLKPTVPDLEGHSVQLFQNKLLIIPEDPATSGKAELFMHSPALIPFHIWGKNLMLERKNRPIFENTLDHGIVDICFENCSRMSEAHFSIASNFKTHLVDYIGERGDNVPRLFSRLPDIETTICLNRKRKRPDKSASCPQIRRAQEHEGFACISRNARPRISHISILEPEESIRKDNQACIHFSETSINFSDEAHKVDIERCQK